MTWPPFGGLGSTGNVSFGGDEIDAAIRNLNIFEDGTGTTRVEFRWDNPVEDAHRFAVYVDGRAIAAISDPEQGFNLDPMPAVSHEIYVIPFRADALDAPDIPSVTTFGDRVYLWWLPSTSADVVAYNIYWDEGDSTDPMPLLATVDEIVTPGYTGLPATSGTGTGTLHVGGAYAGDASNALWQVSIEAGAATFTYSNQDGASGESLTLAPGAWFTIAPGVRVSFPDAASQYEASDTWEFRVGPRTDYTTDPLDAGTYVFAVRAVDAAGNLSDPTNSVELTLTPEPQPPTNIAATYNPSTKTLTVTWTASATAGATYAIFSNWLVQYDTAGEFVFEDSPAWTDTASPLAVVFDEHPEAEICLYVRAVSGGVTERNATLVCVDAYASPPATLEAPEMVSVDAVADGDIRVEWLQTALPNQPTGFVIYTSPDDDWDNATSEATVTFAETLDTATPTDTPGVSRHVWTYTPTAGGAQFVGVRGTLSSLLSPPSLLLPVTTDDTPPSAPGELWGKVV